MEQLAEIVGKNLSSLRKAKGLTQQELAREINYSDKSISKWELGYSLPAVDVLKEFATFYGVTVDYLISPQTEEALVATAKKEEPWANINRGLILAMSMAFVVLVAISVFISEYYSPFIQREGDITDRTWAWGIFFWMVPVCLIIAAYETHRFYHNRVAFITLVSCFIWTVLLCFIIQFTYINKPSENVWYILAVGVPLQVIIILGGHLKRSPKN